MDDVNQGKTGMASDLFSNSKKGKWMLIWKYNVKVLNIYNCREGGKYAKDCISAIEN